MQYDTDFETLSESKNEIVTLVLGWDSGMPTMAYFTDLLASTAEISNLVSVLAVLGGLLVMSVFLFRLIYQVLLDLV